VTEVLMLLFFGSLLVHLHRLHPTLLAELLQP
jgi:hypothetical protein